MSRRNDEVKSRGHQTMMVRAIFLVILFVISVECDDKKHPEKRDVHRIVIIPERNRNNKKRPTKGSTYTHYFNSPDLQGQSTQFSNGLNQISYHNNKMKLPAKNRYHEMQLPEHFFKDNFLDGSTIHVYNTKNGWKPISGISHNQQQHQHSAKYNYIPGVGITTSSSSMPKHLSSTTTSRRPTSNQHKTNKKIHRGKSRFSTTGVPRHKSVAEMIDLTTAFPQPLPPVQTYLNIMTDSHQMADQSGNYLYQNVLVRPRLKKITAITTTSSTTRIPKTKKIAAITTTSKPYEVYENIDEDFPSPVTASGSGGKVHDYGKRIKIRRPARPKTTKE